MRIKNILWEINMWLVESEVQRPGSECKPSCLEYSWERSRWEIEATQPRSLRLRVVDCSSTAQTWGFVAFLLGSISGFSVQQIYKAPGLRAFPI